MPRPSQLQSAFKVLCVDLDTAALEGKRTYQRQELRKLLDWNRSAWGLTRATTLDRFIEFLKAKEVLFERVLVAQNPSSSRRDLTRYTWGALGPYAVSLAIDEKAYLSHGTAVFLHGLTEQVPHTIFVNVEQPGGYDQEWVPNQVDIDRAFQSPMRRTQNVFLIDGSDTRLVVLNGKDTGRLEVGRFKAGVDWVSMTKLERTLIDIVVRPAYAGGVHRVLEAYENAREALSVSVLFSTLQKLEFAYPYHQAIGFCLQHAGVPVKRLQRFKDLGLEHDFYLDHAMPETRYDVDWRLYVPKEI